MRFSILRRSAALLCGAVILFTGCAGGASSSVPDSQSMEDMPYGATLTHDVNASPSIQYDHRFLPEGAADALCRYYRAIQSVDVNLFKGVQFPLWKYYFLNEYLGGKYTDEDILKNTTQQIRDSFGGPFRYALIDVTDCRVNRTSVETESVVAVLDDLAQEKGQELVSKDIDCYCQVKVTRYLSDTKSTVKGETQDAIRDETLYVMHHGSAWYVIYQ